MHSSIDDFRMTVPQCHSLKPVSVVYSNQWFSIKNRGGYYTMEFTHAQVVILPVVNNHSIIMVRVKRPVLADNPLELPAGAAEELEAPLNAAARELREETGIMIDDLDRFQLVAPIAGLLRCPILDRIYHIDISQNEFKKRGAHDNEIDGVKCISFKEVKNKIISGEIYTGVSIAIISRFLFSRMRFV